MFCTLIRFSISWSALLFVSLSFFCHSVQAQTITVIGGSVGNGNFESASGIEDVQTYTQTANWFNTSGDESLNFTNVNSSTIISSSDTGARFGIPAGSPNFPRVSVNNTGWTVLTDRETFDLSYDFLRSTGFWTGDESCRVFLFTTTSQVDANLETSDIVLVAETVFEVPNASLPFWTNGITFDSFYETTQDDVGKTMYLGVETLNPAGLPVYPGLDTVVLSVNLPAPRPTVDNLAVNDADGQRSAVESLSLSFEGDVLFAPGAVAIVQRSTATAETMDPVAVNVAQEVVGDQTIVTIQFDSHVRNAENALVDGNYQLTLDADLITRDGVPMGEDFVFGNEEADGFYSFYGDSNGDRSVNIIDLLSFRTTYGSFIGDANYIYFMDYDGAGAINLFDLLPFRNQFGLSLPFTFAARKNTLVASQPTIKTLIKGKKK